jgi:HEAT repeat protein
MSALLLVGLIAAAPAPEPVLAGRPLREWVKDLADSNPLVREEAVEVLAEAGPAAKEAVPLLEKMLAAEPRTLRTRAAVALWRIAGQTRPAALALAEMARVGATPTARTQALQVLQQMGAGAAPAVPALVALVDDPESEVRRQALATLGMVGQAAVPAVLQGLGDKDPRQRRRAAMALPRLPFKGSEVTPVLAARLTDEDRRVRLQCARLLWFHGDASGAVIDVLTEAVRNGTAAERAEVLTAVSSLTDPSKIKSVRPLLREVLEGTDGAARMRAAQALFLADGKVEEVLPVFLDGLRSSSRGVWSQAAVGVGRIGPPAAAAIPDLVKRLQSGDAVGAVAVREALGRIGPASIPPLVEMMTSAKVPPPAADQAATALGQLGAPAARAVSPLLGHTEARVRRQACQTLSAVGPAARVAVPRLAERLKDADVSIRLAALNALTSIGPGARAAVPQLIAIVKDANAAQRPQYMMALEQIGGDPAALKAVAMAVLHDKDPVVRTHALSLLWMADPKSPDVLPQVRELLKERASRNQALFLIGRMGPAGAGAVPDLIRMLKDPDPYLRPNVIGALGQIGPAAREAVPTLLGMLDQRDHMVRQNIIAYLPYIGTDDPKALVTAVLKGVDQDQDYLRGMVIDLLGAQGRAAADAVPFLLEELRRPRWAFQVQAATALRRIAPERGRQDGVPLVQKWMRLPGTQLAAAGAVLRLDPSNKEALEVLLGALKNDQDVPRQQAAEVLESVGPAARKAVPALREALRDRVPMVRVCAAAAVWQVAGDSDAAVPVLLEGLKAESVLYVRQQAARKLADIGPAAKAAVHLLLEASGNADRHLRALAAIALNKIDPDAAAKAGLR